MNIKEWQKEVNKTAVCAGWYDGELGKLTPTRLLAMLALVHSEVSEATECIREGKMALTFGDKAKPEGFPSELADIIIRVMDMAEALGLDLEEAIKFKNEFNKTRPYRHGGKAS